MLEDGHVPTFWLLLYGPLIMALSFVFLLVGFEVSAPSSYTVCSGHIRVPDNDSGSILRARGLDYRS